MQGQARSSIVIFQKLYLLRIWVVRTRKMSLWAVSLHSSYNNFWYYLTLSKPSICCYSSHCSAVNRRSTPQQWSSSLLKLFRSICEEAIPVVKLRSGLQACKLVLALYRRYDLVLETYVFSPLVVCDYILKVPKGFWTKWVTKSSRYHLSFFLLYWSKVLPARIRCTYTNIYEKEYHRPLRCAFTWSKRLQMSNSGLLNLLVLQPCPSDFWNFAIHLMLYILHMRLNLTIAI